MALVVPAEPLRLDQSWSDAMQDIRTPLLTHLALVFNALGRGLGWSLSLAAVGVVLSARRRFFALLVFAATEAVTSPSSTVLKILVHWLSAVIGGSLLGVGVVLAVFGGAQALMGVRFDVR
jgi:hypothetical protein